MSKSTERNKILFPDDDQYIEMLGAAQYAINYCAFNAYLALKSILKLNKEFHQYSIENIQQFFIELEVKFPENKDYKEINQAIADILYQRNAIYFSKCITCNNAIYETDIPNKQLLWYYDRVINSGIYITKHFLKNLLDQINDVIGILNKYISLSDKKLLN